MNTEKQLINTLLILQLSLESGGKGDINEQWQEKSMIHLKAIYEYIEK